MRVKRFVADNAQQAIAQVKKDLGKDALILHSRPFKEGGFLGLFAKKRYEVLAAVDNMEKMNVPSSPKDETEPQAKQPLFKIEQEMILPELEKVKKELTEIKEAIEGVSAQVRMAPNFAPPSSQPKKIEIHESMIQTLPIKLKSRPTVVALVGPTGVGKTTTIAKLAANFALFEGKSVGLITIDTYRIAAVEQLKTYSEIINLPIEVVYTAAEFKRALVNLEEKELILIDTAGRSQKNKQQIRELRHFFNGRRLDETHLVLSANTKLEDLLETAESFQEIEYNRLIFTKLDETNNLGNVLEVADRLKIPMSYVTTGQNVPEDIEVATFEVIKRYAGKECFNA